METTTRRFLATSPPAKKKKPVTGQKRPPQRGLGVEKLERLRLQERWRMMTETEIPFTPPTEHQIQRSSIHELLFPHTPFFPAVNGAQNQVLRSGGVFAIGSSMELPSSQIEEKLSRPKFLTDSAFFETIEDRSQRTMEIKLFEFFPCSSRIREESQVASSGFACNGKETRLDLTLKLSSQ